ncbi:MAG: PAS domain S-box protein [Acidimicrobiales bacterium]
MSQIAGDMEPGREIAEPLGDNDECFRLLVEGVRDYAILMLDAHGNVVTWNSGAARLKGYAAADIIGRHFSVFYPEADVVAGKPAWELEMAARDGRLKDEGWRLRRDGSRFWANVLITAVRGPDGTLRGFSKVTRDMTATREHQAALAASEERYRTVVDQLNEGVVLQNADFQIVTANAAAARILGLSRDQLTGGGSLDPRWRVVREDGSELPGDEHPAVVALRTDEPQLDRILGMHKPDGAVVWVKVSAQALRRPGAARPHAVAASFIDITAERERQDELARERAALAEAQSIAHVGSWSWNPATDAAHWSLEMYRIFGRDPAAGPAAGEDFFAYLHADDHGRIVAGYVQAFGVGERFELWYRVVVGGETRSLHAIGSRDSRGCYVGTVQDVTERDRIEGAKREAEQLLALAFENSPVGMTLWTPDRRSVRVNRAFAEMLGYTPEELVELADQPSRFTHPDDHAADAAQVQALREGGGDGAQWEKRYLHADGHFVWAHVSVSVLRGADGSTRHIVAQIEDISERKQRDAEEHALRRVAELVVEGAGTAAVFAAVAGEVRDLFDARNAAVTRFEPDTNRGVVVSAKSSDGADLTGAVFHLDGVTASAEVFRTGATARFDRPRPSVTDPAAASMAEGGVTGGVAAPIFAAGTLWGTIGTAFSGQTIPKGTEARLERFSTAISAAIANAEAWDALARQATTDAVTGLANNRAFYERLHAEVERTGRYRRNLSVVMLDLDHFKQVNDLHGHQAGDRVLAEVARRLRAEARDGDLVARIGGEEFAWLMPETDQEGALAVAERARRAIHDGPFAEVGTVTVSAGVCASTCGPDAGELVRHADLALYRAKGGGRNRTVVCTGGEMDGRGPVG